MEANFFEWINRNELNEIRTIKRLNKLKNSYEEELEEEESDIISFISRYGLENSALVI